MRGCIILCVQEVLYSEWLYSHGRLGHTVDNVSTKGKLKYPGFMLQWMISYPKCCNFHISTNEEVKLTVFFEFLVKSRSMPISSHKPVFPGKDHIRGLRSCSCSSNPLPLGTLVPLHHSVVSLDSVVPLCLFVPCHLYICVLELKLLIQSWLYWGWIDMGNTKTYAFTHGTYSIRR